MLDEDWDLLQAFFPASWQFLARRSKALKGLHGDQSAGAALRLLLLHVGCGLSLRETAVRARRSALADVSDVAVLKRLRKSREWLRQLCLKLFRERGVPLGRSQGMQVRVFDASSVKEPGKTGSVWRLHYSVQLPSLTCDFFKVTGTAGPGTGESFRQFPVAPGDHILADRGYSAARGIRHIAAHGGFVSVRVNTVSLPMQQPDGGPFALIDQLSTVTRAGEIACWPVQVTDGPQAPIPGRLCVVRKNQAAVEAEIKRCQRIASKNGHVLRPETLVAAAYVVIFTTFPEQTFSPLDVLLWYRMRWQVELVFKRFKQLAHLGHLPKADDASAEAWLYGKLFVALLTEKMISHAKTLSPWGYDLENATHPQPVA
jgi:hypothetical protein